MAELLIRRTDLRMAKDGRTVFGLCVPYGVDTVINESFGSITERFERGSFARSIRERGSKVKLMLNHERRKLPVGRATLLEERSDGLYGEFLVSDTADGRDALTLVRDEVVDSFSIGFRPLRNRMDGDVTVRVEAALHEVSLVAFPAYEGALIGGVRSAIPQLSVEVARRRLALLKET